jgi:hypothetical protein
MGFTVNWIVLDSPMDREIFFVTISSLITLKRKQPCVVMMARKTRLSSKTNKIFFTVIYSLKKEIEIRIIYCS